MFGTIRKRIYAINVIFLFVTFIIIIFGVIIFNYYTLSTISTNNDTYYYKFDNFSSIEDTILYRNYEESNFFSQKFLLSTALDSFLYKYLFFSFLLFIVIVLILSVIFLKIYNRYILPMLDIDSSTVPEFVEVNRNIKRKEDEIFNQRENLYKINKYITHEFKNSLMVLKGKYYLNPDNAIKYIDEINKQIDDLNALTTNKVDISNIDFLIILAEVIDNFDQNIIFTFESEDYEVQGNTTLIYRVLYNILDNAYKYGAKNVSVNVSKHYNNVICEIINDGPKMNDKELDEIFKMNYRINKLNKSGSGIGLSLVKNVMHILGGSVFVKSTKNETVFILSFVVSKENYV